VTLNYLQTPDPNGTNVKAAAECSKQSGGKFVIKLTPLPNSADAQRELLVRRLAAGDSSIDLMYMDTIWTPEFAEAGWAKQLPPEYAQKALNDVLPGPKAAVTWNGKTYAFPNNTNVQLLWYRKDLVPNPPKTWDEMIQMAKKLPANEGAIEEQGAHYEGYVVWFNNLVESDGGKIAKPDGSSALDQSAVKAASIIHNVATSGRSDPSLSTDMEDQARLAFEQGKAAFELNWPYVYAAGRTDAETNPTTKKVFQNMGWAPYPAVDPNKPARVSIGGNDIGVSTTGKHQDLALQAAACMTAPKWNAAEAINEGNPPIRNSTYDDPAVRKVYPFADIIRDELKNAVTRPETPAYSDVTLAIQDTLSPPAKINPAQDINTLKSRLKTLADGGMY
jgi:multiple sugar transport system substrate-binding protein